LGCVEGQTVIRPAAEVYAHAKIDLRRGAAEEPVAAAIFVRVRTRSMAAAPVMMESYAKIWRLGIQRPAAPFKGDHLPHGTVLVNKDSPKYRLF
jgi:hypothetical protein